MRFSLGTLVLVVLLSGTLMLVWRQRDPWVRYQPYVARRDPNNDIVPRVHRRTVSIDALRRIEIHHRDEYPDCVTIVENAGLDEGRIIWQVNGNFYDALFLDDDTLALDDYTRIRTFHRRFPEWWWGHFYRPEMWCAIVLSGALIFKFFRRRTKTRHRDAP
jgi:hypothetical protein